MNPPAAKVLAAVRTSFDVSIADLTGPRRLERITVARFAAWHILRKYPRNTLCYLGEIMGGRDHGAVINGLKRAESLLLTDDDFRERHEAAEASLREPDAPELPLGFS